MEVALSAVRRAALDCFAPTSEVVALRADALANGQAQARGDLVAGGGGLGGACAGVMQFPLLRNERTVTSLTAKVA